MKKINFIIKQSVILFLGIFLGILVLSGCAAKLPKLLVTQYRFKFNDESYRLRSISSKDSVKSYNELIGGKFLAVDYNQDGVLDHIRLGDVDQSETQKIYEYGIDALAKENKLQVRNPDVERYAYENDNKQYEIISFQPADARPFNEFKIIQTTSSATPNIIIVCDQNADGTLDDILIGGVAVEKLQSQYQDAVTTGLQTGRLQKVDGTILVKAK
jgi:hypothetical protein